MSTKMPGTTSYDEMVAARYHTEQRWLYERRIERMTYRDLSDLSALPVAEGGLGYRLSIATISRRIKAARKELAELEAESRDEYRARELEGMDKRERALYKLLDRVDREATIIVARSLGYTTIDELAAHSPAAVVLRDERIVLGAMQQIERVAAERRKLLGLDAPVEAKLDVTHHDAVNDELSKMLAEAGITPEKTGTHHDATT
jgi:hypothetical protein